MRQNDENPISQSADSHRELVSYRYDSCRTGKLSFREAECQVAEHFSTGELGSCWHSYAILGASKSRGQARWLSGGQGYIKINFTYKYVFLQPSDDF